MYARHIQENPGKKISKSQKDLKSARNMFFFFLSIFKVKSARNMYIKSEPWLSSADIVYLEIKVSTYL